MISRRQMLQTSAGLALGAGFSSLVAPAAMAQASTVDVDDLMVAGPLADKVLGSADAKVTVVEYASMTCGHCANFHHNTYKPFVEKYVDTGLVKFVFREFPLDSVAMAASMLARCAPEDTFFDVIDAFFAKQRKWAYGENVIANMQEMAFQVGFTEKSFSECLTNQELLDGINWIRKRAVEEFQVSSTPTFFFNGTRQPGSMAIDEMDAIIQPLL